MSNSIPVIKFLFSSEFRVLNETLQAQPSYEVEDFNAVNDLATFVSTIPAGLIISSLHDKNDLVQIASFMKIVKKVAKDTAIKMVVINFSGDKQFEKAIAKLGIQDLVEPAINAKAFKFKLDFWMKSLNAQIKNNPNANAQKNVKSAEVAKAQDKKVDNSAPTWLEPLDLEDDIWIVSNETDCKKILSKWLIKLTGPGPYVGQWNDVQNNLWRFEIKGADKDMYVPGSGHWYFHGDVKPDFVWKENVWLITGDSFDLFYKDGDKVFSRLKCKDKNFTVCKNSLYAKTKEQVIKESFDKDMVFRKEAEALNDLEGKGKADSINGGPLSGKNKTSHLNQNPLSGEISPEDQLLNTDPLTQNTSTDKQSSFWKGKNTYENESGDGSGPASAGVHAGQNLEQENKKNEHQKYYKNHNEAEKYEAEKKELERKLSEQKGGSGPLSGKSSTDEIDGHYSNDGERKAKSVAERPQSELSGKSETDKLNSHYGSKDGSSPTGKPEREHSESSSNEKSSTHKDREASSAASRDGGLAGKGSTDRMDSHYSNPDDGKNAKAKTEENKSRTSMASSEGSTTGKGSFSDTKDTAENGSSHYAHAKDEKRGNEGAASADPYESLFGKSKDRKEAPAAKKTERKVDADYTNFTDEDLRPSLDEKQRPALADVVSLNNYKNEKLKEALEESYDPEIEEASADAKVSSTMFFNSKPVDCRFDDFFDETIIFTTTDLGLSADSKVDVDMSFKYLNQDTKVKIQGDVVTVEGDGEGNNYVTVQLSKDNVETFDKFMRLYKLRQENANSFIKKVKGL